MSNLILRKYNGVEIPQRADGYMNATKMCQAGDKLFADFWRLRSTDEYVRALSKSMGIPIDALSESIVSGPNELRGTWVHKRLASRLAQWISPEFAVVVDGWVLDIAEGRIPGGMEEILSRDRAERRLQLENQARGSYNQMMENQAKLCAALSIIKEEELWRDIRGSNGEPVFDRFADYCEQIIGVKKSQANAKVQAGDIIRKLTDIPDDWKPKSIAALTLLAQIDEEERIEVLEQLADESNPPTAFNVKRAIHDIKAQRETEALEQVLDLPSEKPTTEEAQRHSSSGKIIIQFQVDEKLKEPLTACAKRRQMSVSTFVANLVFRELREASGIGEAPEFRDMPW
ncbi:MAG: KilA-N domain-containing protein [Cyanobacteria bacterium J06638_20]